MPLIVQSTKHHPSSFNLSIINSQMQIAKHSKATLEETKVAIVNMYQNGTTQNLSSKAQKAAHALAQYIYAHKANKKFAFVLGKDHQDQQLLLLTISNNSATPQGKVSLQKGIRQALTSTQKQEDLFSVKQLWWVTKALHKAEFGILFWIYQHRLSNQEALPGTKQVPLSITAVNFQRVKTSHEQLQDQAWAKTIAVIQKLNSRQLKISGDPQQLPSQTKITTSHIVLAIQKIITNDDDISKAASKLIKEVNIEMQPVDKIGAMIITIQNYGHDKIMIIFGFKATGTLLEIAQAKINAAKDGASLPTRFTQVFYGQTPLASNINAPTKNGMTFRFKSATAINNKGESTLTYEVDVNPQVKGTKLKDATFVVSGFETQDQKDAREVIKKRLDTTFKNIRDGALVIPKDITTSQFDEYVQAMGNVLNKRGEFVKSKFAEQHRAKITSLTIPSSFSTIGAWFQDFNKITSLSIPNSVTSIGDYAFAFSPLTTLSLGEALQTIGNGAFGNAKLTSLSIPNSVTSIGDQAFYFSLIATLSLGNQLKMIGNNAFQHAQLKILTIPNSVTSIGIEAFLSSPLTTLSLGNQLQTIGTSAFQKAQLTSLLIPNSVTTIGQNAFLFSPLTTINIFEDVTLGVDVFKSKDIVKQIPRPPKQPA